MVMGAGRAAWKEQTLSDGLRNIQMVRFGRSFSLRLMRRRARKGGTVQSPFRAP